MRKATSKDAGIGIKEHRNEKGAKKRPGKQCTGDAGVLFFELLVHPDGKEKHWKKEKLHMLPGGLVYRKEETKDVIVVRPLIHKMCEGAGNRYKKNAFDDIRF